LVKFDNFGTNIVNLMKDANLHTQLITKDLKGFNF